MAQKKGHVVARPLAGSASTAPPPPTDGTKRRLVRTISNPVAGVPLDPKAPALSPITMAAAGSPLVPGGLPGPSVVTTPAPAGISGILGRGGAAARGGAVRGRGAIRGIRGRGGAAPPSG
jgi:hypothetical protein